MKNIHKLYTEFKKECPEIDSKYRELGKAIHKGAGPIKEKDRWLIKIGISGASGHLRALETHMLKAKEAGATQDEIKQTLLLLISTVGFPTFMESYSVYKKTFENE